MIECHISIVSCPEPALVRKKVVLLELSRKWLMVRF